MSREEAINLLKDVKGLWIELHGDAYVDLNGGQDYDKAIDMLESVPGELLNTWHEGSKPDKADWYIVRYLSNDKIPAVMYEKLWFNPEAPLFWWYSFANSIPFSWCENITHFILFHEACEIIDRLTAKLAEARKKPEQEHLCKGCGDMLLGEDVPYGSCAHCREEAICEQKKPEPAEIEQDALVADICKSINNATKILNSKEKIDIDNPKPAESSARYGKFAALYEAEIPRRAEITLLLEAAKEIDCLTAELARLTRWHDYFAWEREMEKLQAELKAKDEKYRLFRIEVQEALEALIGCESEKATEILEQALKGGD